MKVSNINDVKVYNLSAGKSLPEWLSDRKKRALLKNDVDIRRRIELIQDFDMPGVSTSVKMSPDGHYIMATGVYKPRVRCYEVDNLAMKFERCFDSEVITFEILSDDYSKMAFLQCDRYVELHSAEGQYYRLRIPKFGHDLKYHPQTCDLCLVGASCDIYRLNLERGQFLSPFVTSCSGINKIAINNAHGLIMVGGEQGKVEAWDPRLRSATGTLDCALSSLMHKTSSEVDDIPAIISLEFNGALTLGVGVSTGHVLLYDIRSNKPFTVKDHMYSLPITDIAFHGEHVISMDSCAVKIWNKDTGKPFTTIEAGNDTKFNNLCVVPDTGMMFIANENVKIRTYYIPNLGPAPKWCGFLDALTEELEENTKETIYDDYKFVTQNDLQELGLDHLIGTNLLRAYMHGYFIDLRLYRKAKTLVEPFTYEQYTKKKVKEIIEQERTSRVQVKKLPAVNKELALKLMEDETSKSKKRKLRGTVSLLQDERFKALFENPEFEIDCNAEEYRLLNPVLKRLDRDREDVKNILNEVFEPVEEEKKESSSEESSDESDYSSDDDAILTKELKNEYREAKRRRIIRTRQERREKNSNDDDEGTENDGNIVTKIRTNSGEKLANTTKEFKIPKMYEIKTGQEYLGLNNRNIADTASRSDLTLEERIKLEDAEKVETLPYGNRSMSFVPNKDKRQEKQVSYAKQHHTERKRMGRPPPRHLRKPKFYAGPKRRR